uniref:cAMP-dependent protein kinase regulatory subunit n=1 Tax=Magallana gigas TaxID=29159 RepID=K1QSD3_MAGGI
MSDLEIAEDSERMLKVVKDATDNKSFYDTMERNREHDGEEEKEEKDLPPVFNKRLFVTQGAVIITKEARRIMAQNARCSPDQDPSLTKSEMLTLRSVVEGLKLIHKGQDYIKNVLSRCVTLENYNAFQYVKKKPWEDTLSCYYVVHGAVEVTYDMSGAGQSSSRNVYQPNIIYSHGTAEYLGIVSAEGRDEDIAPPATVYTKEQCEFIRIDRDRFHRLIEVEETILKNEIQRYFKSGSSILSILADDVQAKILQMIQKHEYPPNKTLLEQGEETEYLYVIVSGRVQCYREVYIPEADRSITFYVCCREKDDFFGEEGVLDHDGSYCKITTTTPTVCYRFHRTALKIVNSEKLERVLQENRHDFVSEEELRDRGYKNHVWNNYKHNRIKESLKEKGKLKYMCKMREHPVADRPPTEEEQTTENMYRFVLKGSKFTPLQVRPLSCHSQRSRPHTAPAHFHKKTSPELDEPSESESDSESEDEETKNKQLMTSKLAKTLDELCTKNLDADSIMNIMDENSEIGRHLKKAWETQDVEQPEQESFMKNGILAIMGSDDIVRKAMAMADKEVSHQRRRRSAKDDKEWNTVVHAENSQAKFLVAANKMRINLLRKNLAAIDKERKLNAQKRIRINRKPYTTESKENVESSKQVKVKGSEKNNHSQGQEDTEKKDGNATLFVSRSQKRWRPSTVNSEVTEGSPTRNHDNTPTRGLITSRPNSASSRPNSVRGAGRQVFSN